jgi:sialate O-acetylesterase
MSSKLASVHHSLPPFGIGGSKRRRALALLAFLFLAFALPAHAKIELPLLFSDGAVFQRDQPLPVWGWSTPGAKIEVAFDGRSARATAAAGDGTWRVELPAHAAGGPYTLTVRENNGDTITVRDVLVGDVWLASGQSNMEWPVLESLNAEAEIARANDTGIRHFKVPKSWAETPQTRLAGGQWRSASPQTVGEFTAVGYFFARELRARDPDVPIGIIDSTWGGSAIETWMSADMLGLDQAALKEKLRRQNADDAQAEARTRALIANWPKTDPGQAWAKADLDESVWSDIKVPAIWEDLGYAGMDGVAWYRTAFELDAREAANGVILGLGKIDDTDQAFVNGQQVGGMENGYNKPRAYNVPASALRTGRNTIAVRVIDGGGGGGIAGKPDELYVETTGGARRPLAGSWKFRTAAVTVSLQDQKNQIDTLLYNKMIRPLQPYPLRGALWYQGETNAWAEKAFRYRDQFAVMIRGWREAWHAPQLPFLWVQLANFDSGGDDATASDAATRSSWAMLRESQSAVLKLPHTAQAVAIDIGDAHDIHPRNKQEVGRRLALAARHVAYGESLVYSGPVYRAVEFDGRNAHIAFDTQGSALAVRGGGKVVHGFEIAGDDRRFHPAHAEISGDRVIVSSDAVARSKAVRYAWSDNPEDADLVNGEGLPASPFRTDEW